MASQIEPVKSDYDPKVVETGDDDRIAQKLQKQREEKRLL